jgi:MFS family permease
LLRVAQFVAVLDVTIVAIALPAIQESLGFSRVDLQWVVSAYTLVFGGFLLFAGRAADLYGRRLFVIGFALFSGASLACGLAFTARPRAS